MGSAFQVPLYSGNGQSVASLDYSNELKSLGVTLDLLKTRTSQLSDAHKHSTSYSSLPTSYDPDTAHMLEAESQPGAPYVRQKPDVVSRLSIKCLYSNIVLRV